MFLYLLALLATQLPFILFLISLRGKRIPKMPSLSKKPVKGVLLVRNDLKMGKGKIVAQAMHAAYAAAQKESPLETEWKYCGFKKVSLRVEGEEEMNKIIEKLKKESIPYNTIIDAGRTQVEPNTHTVTFVGPAYEEDIDRITGDLKLL